jgi:tripartite-type tricarboxylate transporter receptor subunit TctC
MNPEGFGVEVTSMRDQKKIFWRVVILLPLWLLFFAPLGAFGQDFPTKPITIYCGQSAGATTDLTARAIAVGVQEELGVPVVVEDKAGGGQTVAATLLASKKGDGYTLGAIGSSALDIRHMILKLAYDPFKDFTYIIAYGEYPGGLCVKTDSPFKTLADLVEHARKNPGALSYSSSGTGAPHQIAIEYLARQAEVKFKHVPFAGGAPACTALIGGHVDFTAGAGIHLNYLKQGIFRMLAVTTSTKREPKFPDVPTLKDLGYKMVPSGGEYLILAPKGVPAPVLKKLELAFRKVAYSRKFQERLENLDVPFAFKDRHQLETEAPQNYQFWGELMKELGLLRK